MQQIVNPQIPAQHLPAGWAYPNHAAQSGPAPAAVPSALGAGTETKIRWGRLLPVLAGIALIAFGVWNVTHSGSPATSSGDRSVSGGGAATDEVNIAKAKRADTAMAITPAVAPKPPGASRTTSPKSIVRRSSGGLATSLPRTAPLPPAARGVRTGTPSTVAGGGAAAPLPYTGMETWIAALLGALLLGVGICVHVNAVRIGMTALLYRRGILLRPIDCARMAQSHGPARIRVGLSDFLHRLLEQPAGGGDFVSARLAR